MSELQNPTSRPVAPAQAPTGPATSSDGAAEVYRRAVAAKPTGFAENPIGAMAQAVDRLGKAAGGVLSGGASKSLEGQDGLAAGEAKLKQAIAAMRANPSDPKAKQAALAAALELISEMDSLAPNDPRRLAVSKFVVGLANQLGAAGQLPTSLQGMDVRGLLRSAAQTLSQFGSSADMQAAFALESLIKGSLPASSAVAVAMRDELMQRLGLSRSAQALIASGWAVRETKPGEMPSLDVQGRTLALDSAKGSPSLSVLARAYWHDRTLQSPQDRDGFMEAFQKVANQGTVANLSRKYREVRDHARRELQQARVGIGAAGASGGRVDEDADMFGSLATFAKSGEQVQLPDELREPLDRFFA